MRLQGDESHRPVRAVSLNRNQCGSLRVALPPVHDILTDGAGSIDSFVFGGGGRRVIEWLEVTLRAWAHCGEYVPPSEWFDRLIVAAGDPVMPIRGDGLYVSRVRLLRIDAEQFAQSGDYDERMWAMAAAIRRGLLGAAGWLGRQEPDVFAGLRAAGRVTDVLVGGWVHEARLLLDFPPEFLGACGRLGLVITVCTNDWGQRAEPPDAPSDLRKT